MTYVELLTSLAALKSKHSCYQILHPWIREAVKETYLPSGKREAERQSYMEEILPLKGKELLDIGANTGYFSFSALEKGAKHVTAVEGNAEHARFLVEASRLLGIENRFNVENSYFNFSAPQFHHLDIILCLNVLHHLGDDFGDPLISLAEAKIAIAQALARMAKHSTWMWLQLGFNWKGDKSQPLFTNGLKIELIDFVSKSCISAWSIVNIAIYNPDKNVYENASDQLLKRFDPIGEFLNRPLFLLRSVF